MKRKIKFRGLKKSENEWVYGYLTNNIKVNDGVESNHLLIGKDFEYDEVRGETVGEFTGLYDVDGREIYEGDIISVLETDGSEEAKFEVCFDDGAFVTINYCDGVISSDRWIQLLIRFEEVDSDIRVIDNIHNNEQ